MVQSEGDSSGRAVKTRRVYASMLEGGEAVGFVVCERSDGTFTAGAVGDDMRLRDYESLEAATRAVAEMLLLPFRRASRSVRRLV